MHNKKTLFVISAIALMLASATSAHAYYETWDGWFNSGNLYCNGNSHASVGSTVVADSTVDSLDYFYLQVDAAVIFVNGYDTISLGISSFSGVKTTGQSGQKEGNGYWSGMAIYKQWPGFDPDTFYVSGTWDTNGDKCFNYGGYPAIYSANWNVTSCIPRGITGSGTSSGDNY